MNVKPKVRRVAVLWEHVTGYLQAGLRALLIDDGVRLFVVERSREANASFGLLSDPRCTFLRLHELPRHNGSWLDTLLSFSPELALITGNRDPRYVKAACEINHIGGLVIWASDRVLRAPIRDLYQVLLGRVVRLWKAYDAAFVPGHEAAKYARHIGFPADRVFQGLYGCDTSLYQPIGIRRHGVDHGSSWPRVFLYVGQFIERKGVDTLLAAYRRYRSQVDDPWELWCAGAGPLQSTVMGEGVRGLGFLSPADCAQVMARSGALVIPSRWDHWGVVIHEATCAGLPILASQSCYAAVELVQDGYNGFTFPAGDVDALVRLLSVCSDPELARQMGANSLCLSHRFGPELFAWQVLENIPSTLWARQGRG